MEKQGGENADEILANPHLYMSAVRGTQSYWKKYTGDLIAMIKTIGTPTFFLTSFDDLNSKDVIKALWKAKHGYDSEDVNPEDIPYIVRKELLNSYPIVAARHFSLRLTKLHSKAFDNNFWKDFKRLKCAG